jgi:hypothetical protein
MTPKVTLQWCLCVCRLSPKVTPIRDIRYRQITPVAFPKCAIVNLEEFRRKIRVVGFVKIAIIPPVICT